MRRIVLTDVDNTLFSWIDFFAPCFRALVHAVSRESRIPEAVLYDAFQVTFRREGSVEYRRAIQDNLAIRELPEEQQVRLVDLGSRVFSMAMRSNLRPYEGVVPTLRRLRSDGVSVVAVTNSGALQAIHRIRQLGLAKLLDGVVAWDHDVAQMADSQGDYDGALQSRISHSGLNWVTAIPTSDLKPSPTAYRLALDRLGGGAQQVWIVGDSLEKDLSAAPALGAKSVWAEYGHRFDPANFETLRRITHWSEDKIKRAYDREIIEPDHTIDQYRDLLGIVDLRQGELF